MAGKRAEASETIAAGPERVYDLVSDLAQMGKWSPEAVGGRWVGGATGPAIGARFRGNNRSGWRRWSTVATVIAADRGKRFAFRVTLGPFPISEWSYDFEATAEGTTRVIERWLDLRSPFIEVPSRPVMGVYDRPEHNKANMVRTLAVLKASIENDEYT